MTPLNIGEITDHIVTAVQNAGIKQVTSAMLMAQIALLKNQSLTDRSAYQKQNTELDACKLENRDLQLQLADLKEKMRKLNEPVITRQARRILKLLTNYNEISGPSSEEVASSLQLKYNIFISHFYLLKKLGFVRSRRLNYITQKPAYVWITLKGRLFLGTQSLAHPASV